MTQESTVTPSENLSKYRAVYHGKNNPASNKDANNTPLNQVRLPHLIIDDLLGRSRSRPNPAEPTQNGAKLLQNYTMDVAIGPK